MEGPRDVVHEKANCPELAKYTQNNVETPLPPLTVTQEPNQQGIAVHDMGETWVIDGGWHHSKTGLVYRGACQKHRVYVSFYRGDKPYGQQTYDWDETHHYTRKDHWAKP